MYDAKPMVFGHAATLPLRDASFKIITCMEALEHARSPDLVMADINRALATRGYISISVSPLHPLHYAPYHVDPFASYGLQRATEGADLEFEKSGHATCTTTNMHYYSIGLPCHRCPI